MTISNPTGRKPPIQGEKMITKKEFDKAVYQVQREMVHDDDLNCTARLMVPLIGSIFASKMCDILFDEEKEDK